MLNNGMENVINKSHTNYVVIVFKSVYSVVCEDFVSPGLLYNLLEILSFKKSQNLNISQCRFGCSRVRPEKIKNLEQN